MHPLDNKAGHVSPGRETLSEDCAVVGGVQAMTTGAEVVTNRPEWLEEALNLFWALEPTHRPLAFFPLT